MQDAGILGKCRHCGKAIHSKDYYDVYDNKLDGHIVIYPFVPVATYELVCFDCSKVHGVLAVLHRQ